MADRIVVVCLHASFSKGIVFIWRNEQAVWHCTSEATLKPIHFKIMPETVIGNVSK